MRFIQEVNMNHNQVLGMVNEMGFETDVKSGGYTLPDKQSYSITRKNQLDFSLILDDGQSVDFEAADTFVKVFQETEKALGYKVFN